MQEKKLAAHAITALEKLCQSGGQVLQAHTELLLQIIDQAVDVPNNVLTQFIECVAGLLLVCIFHGFL